MAAKKTGGHGASQKAKDAAMAARLKADGVKRAVLRCPICSRMTGIDGFYNHLNRCR